MVDWTSITQNKGVQSAFLVIIYLSAVLSMIWVQLIGYQTRQIEVLLTGSILIGGAYLADRLSSGQIFRTTASWLQLALSWKVGLGAALFISWLLSTDFGFLALPASHSGYLSVLEATTIYMKTIVNGWWAPVIETFIAIAMTIVAFELLKTFLPKALAAVLAGTPGSYLFMQLHSSGNALFNIYSFSVMFVLLGILFLEDAVEGNQSGLLPLTVLFLVGFHQGINVDMMGGYLTYMNRLWLASGPTSDIAMTIFIIEIAGWAIIVIGGLLRLSKTDINLPSLSTSP